MQIRTKFVTLEFIAGFFGWSWILASCAAVYFVVAALAFDGRWSWFFWSLGCAAIAKWLARAFNDTKMRVAYEAEGVARGLSKEEAGRAWLLAYSGAPDRLAPGMHTEPSSERVEGAQRLVNQYGAVLERCSEPICSEELLPATKEGIKRALIAAAQATKAMTNPPPQMLEQLRVGYASLANFVDPSDAEIAAQLPNLMKRAASVEAAGDEAMADVVTGDERLSRAIQIQQESNEEFARLVQEFDESVGR